MHSAVYAVVQCHVCASQTGIVKTVCPRDKVTIEH